MTAVPLIAGEYYTREDLVVEYGGSVQSGGIVPGNRSNTVFVFTDPSKGTQFGYVYDGFSPDGTVFYYTGAGQDGDQVETGANSPILTHAEKGRTLHAFVAAGRIPGRQTKRQRYIGEFVLDPQAPYERMPALDRNKSVRTVIVFRLLPIAAIPEAMLEAVGTSGIAEKPTSLRVPVELNSTHFFETSGIEARTAVRRESQLVEDFVASQTGHDFSRWAIRVPKEPLLLTDVYDQTDQVLYEAKALSGRSDVRMAVGQLYDYRRHLEVENLRCSILLPERPGADLRDLIEVAGLGLAFRDGERFEVQKARSTI